MNAMIAPVNPHHSTNHTRRWNIDETGELLASIFVFNALDVIATISWLQMGMATEANPAMDILIGVHPALFAGAKLLLVGLGITLLSLYRDRRAVKIVTYSLFALYTLLICYHISGGLLSA